jgi:UTP--glucose-1-phosphate uridylyltransferase
VQVVPRQDTEKYGIVAVEADRAVTSRVRSIVEKPKPAVAPSNLAVVGRYVLAPAIFEHLEKLGSGTGGEIQLTDGIAALMREEAVYAYRFSGKRYDCGSKLGYLQATVEYALAHPELGRSFRRYLQGLDVAGSAAAGARPAAAGNGGAVDADGATPRRAAAGVRRKRASRRAHPVLRKAR